MSQIPTREAVQSIHATYVRLTGIDVPLTMQAWFMHEAFLAGGYTESDLALVIGYIQKRIKAKRREKESLLLRNLISSQDHFAEDLSMAKMDARDIHVRTDPKRAVLRATGRTPEPSKPAQTPAQVMEQHAEMHRLLKQWRQENPL